MGVAENETTLLA